MIHWLGNPNTAVSVLLGGLLLIYAEFNRPGTILPGAAGFLLVLLGSYGLGRDGVSLAAALGVTAGLALMYVSGRYLQLLVPAVGLFLFCLLRLAPHLNVALIAAEGTVFSMVTILLARVAFRARRNKFFIGAKATVGKRGRSVTALTPDGRIEALGQLWPATLRDPASPLPANATILVHSAQGPVLLVDPVAE